MTRQNQQIRVKGKALKALEKSAEQEGLRHQALQLLIQGKRVTEIAVELQVTRQAITAWLKEPGFASELREAREYELRSVENSVVEAGTEALRSLVRECRGAEEAKDRIRAAEIILTRCFDLRPEASKKALVELHDHQHLDLSGVPAEKFLELLRETRVIEAETVK